MLQLKHVSLYTAIACMILAAPVWAGDAETEGSYTDALANFRSQPATAPFFEKAVAYVIIPDRR